MRKLTEKEFIIRSKKLHCNKYNYELIHFINTRIKVKIICKIHGIFETRPSDHMRGVGCTKCCFDRKRLSIRSFIKKASLVHNDYYKYNMVKYIKFDLEIKIICPAHGVFNQKPYHHLRGRGCRKCFVKNISTDINIFLQKVQKLYNNKYVYDINSYINLHSIINITCPIHGIFHQIANNHFNGSECPFCANSNVSKMETMWLDNLNISYLLRNKILFLNKKRYNVDAFNPHTNTIYEFYGDFWHGNPKKFISSDINPIVKISYGQLYNNTINREQELISYGYKIISIWENDFRTNVRLIS